MTTPEGPRGNEPVEVDPRTLPPPAPPTGPDGDPYAPQAHGQQPYARQPFGQQPYAPQPSGPQPGFPTQPVYGPPYPQPTYGPPGSPQPYGPLPGADVPAWARPKPSPLPTEVVDYQHQLRTPGMRWWKPLAALGLAGLFWLAANFIAIFGLIAVGAAQGVSDIGAYLTQMTDVSKGAVGPVTFGFLNVTLIVLIPSVMFARWIVYGQRPRFLSSVAGGFRWRWLARCLACTVPLWLVYVGLTTVFTGVPEPKPAFWGVLIVLVVLTTPLQCAGEEYAFRGLVMQTVGSWFRRPMVALVAGAIPAMALFAAAHGSPDPLILIQLSIFALSCVIVTWRTGGLEAGIAMHLSNNVILMLISIVYGGWGGGFVDADTKGSVPGVLIEILVDGIAVTLILWQAKRAKIDRRFRPVAPAPASASIPAPQYG